MKKCAKILAQGLFLLGVMFAIGMAFGIEDKVPLKPVDLIDHVNKIVSSSCAVYVDHPRMRPGDSCYSNEVMTGFRNGRIYCGKLSVDCFSKQRLNSSSSNP